MKTKTSNKAENSNLQQGAVSGSNFSAWAMQTVDKNNGGYKHIIEDKTLYITKDGITMKLTDDEVMQVLKALGIATADFRSGFKCGV